MAFKFTSLLSVIVLVIVIASASFYHVSEAKNNRKLLKSSKSVRNSLDSIDGWQSINDVGNPKVVDLAKFAVNEENAQLNGVKLEFGSVSDGSFKVGKNGTTYELTIVALEFDEPDEYDVLILEDPKTNVRKLVSFD